MVYGEEGAMEIAYLAGVAMYCKVLTEVGGDKILSSRSSETSGQELVQLIM